MEDKLLEISPVTVKKLTDKQGYFKSVTKKYIAVILYKYYHIKTYHHDKKKEVLV